MRKLLTFLIAPWQRSNALAGLALTALLISGPASATQMSLTGAGKGGGAFTPSCSQSTTFLARANAVTTLDLTHQIAYNALICGAVADGWYSKLDALYLFAAQSSGVALLNLISTSYTATLTGAPVFETNYGFFGVGTTTGINSNFNATTATSPNYTQNSSHIAAWSNTIGNETAAFAFGDTTTSTTTIFPDYGNPGTYMRLNDATGSGVISTLPDGSGLYLMSRASSTVRNGYWNNTSLGTTSSATSTTPPNANIQFLGPVLSVTSGKQISMASIGGALTSTDASNMYARASAYLAALATPITPFTTCGVLSSSKTQANILTTTDGIRFAAAAGVTNPVYTIPAGGGTGTTSESLGCNLFYSQGQNKYFMAYEMNDLSGTQKTFGISSATSLNGPWTWVTDVSVIPSCSSGCYVWNPHWFVDDDGSVHIYAYYGSSAGKAVTPFIVDCLNTTTYASWSAPTVITGTTSAFPNEFGDFFMLSPNNSPLGLYTIWARNLTTGYFEYDTSSTRTGSYSLVSSNPLSQTTANLYEGITPIKLASGLWRIYYYPTGISRGWQFNDSLNNWTSYLPIQNTSLFNGDTITTGPVSVGP